MSGTINARCSWNIADALLATMQASGLGPADAVVTLAACIGFVLGLQEERAPAAGEIADAVRQLEAIITKLGMPRGRLAAAGKLTNWKGEAWN